MIDHGRLAERARTLLLATGALAAGIAVFSGGWSGTAPQSESRPTSADAGPDGYAALRRAMRERGVRVELTRTPLGTHESAADPARGGLLIVTLPGRRALQPAEVAWVDRWVRAGNTLLVLAAVRDRPAWASRESASLRFDLAALTGFELHVGPGGRAGARGAVREAFPTLALPGFEGVHRLGAFSDESDPAPLDLRAPADGSTLQLAVAAQDRSAVVWLRPAGQGRIVVSSLGSLLGHRALSQADNAAWLAALLATTLQPNAAVIFDDHRQGELALFEPQLLARDPRAQFTAAVLLGLWLLWLVGGTALRPRTIKGRPESRDDALRTRAMFYERVVAPRHAAAQLLALAAQRLGLDPASSADPSVLLRRVAANARISRADVAELEHWIAALALAGERRRGGRASSLATLHNLLVRIERHWS